MQYKNKWIVRRDRRSMQEDTIVREISEKLKITIPTSQLLVNRGCTSPEEAERFIAKKDEHLHDPFLMKDMGKAAERIVRAIEDEEKIVIFGDYDVDGVTSVSCLYLYLKSYGADVSYYIPCRAGEGYGMSEAAVRKLAEGGCNLIITVDTGITAVAEAALACELGVDLVITDHHECHSTIPEAVAVVNPHRPDCEYPFKELAGVGVVFKLLCAIETMLHPELTLLECVRNVSREYCDLVAIGTVADVMPVRDENRLIVSFGLSLIDNTTRPGLAALIEAARTGGKSGAKRKATAAFIGFTLAPRINAAGRIRDASMAVELFLTEDTDAAAETARSLCEINHERQEEENKIASAAYAKIESEHDFEHDRVIVLDDENWHHGVIGIVASRITEKYGCPSILISFEGSGEGILGDDVGKGSGRSIKGMNLVESLSACSELLEKFGGHELAAGLSIKRENLDEFKRKINEHASFCIDESDTQPSIEAECELSADDITMTQANELYYLEPCGVSNPVPVFAYRGALVDDITLVGGGKHTRISLKIGGHNVCAMYFRQTISDIDIYPGDTVDVIFTLDVNEFQNQRSVQMLVKDIRLTETQFERESAERELYCTLRGGDGACELGLDEISVQSIVPTHADFASVYNVLKRELRLEHEVFSIRALTHLLSKLGVKIGYVKLKNIIMIFRELGILDVTEIEGEHETYGFKYVHVKTKANLEDSEILKKLKATLGRE